MRQKRLLTSLIALSLGGVASAAHAAPTLRKQVDQKGDFVIFGNTVGFECAEDLAVPVPEPAAGSTATCPNVPNPQQGQLDDSSPDIFWRSDSPMDGQATASAAITADQARSTAVLDIPTGATVTYARIYWAGLQTGNMSTDADLRIERPGTALDSTVTADGQFYLDRGNNSWYQSTADITTLVVANGEGAYRISDIASIGLNGINNDDPMVAWVAVVLYSLPTDPPRNLAIFDGLDLVADDNDASVSLSGFLVPNAGFDAKLGVIAYEGEQKYVGDALSFNGTALSNGANPVDNFFNSTRSYLGTAVSNAGDLPRLTGGAASMAGVDMDVVDVKATLQSGDTSADIVASSSGDTYLLGAFVTSISTFKPDFTTSGKTFTDLNGGSLLPGDVVEYSITVTNTGNDASVNTIVTDPLPAGVTYVPASIRITSGPGNGGPFTDAADDDRGQYIAGTRTVRARLGTALAAEPGGGSLAINQTTVVTFQVTIDATASGSILNQAIVTAEGEQGAPSDDFPTDGNGNGSGEPPTEVIVDKCATNAQCAAPTPACDTAPTPNVCVECLVAADCTNPGEPQCLPDHTCGCTTNCADTDGDGLSDATEDAIGTEKNDADSDDDGVKDGDEPDKFEDTDLDGKINPLDPDSDDDGLYDGTELGLPCDGAGTEPGSTHCIADGDPDTKTDPLDADTDDGGVRDGSEDVNHDGAKDTTETDPTTGNGADDGSLDDTDDDGLTDDEEDAIGTNPMDADSDDDGVLDGDEVNPSDDADGDGLINAKDPDSDDDGLYDGTELGLDCGDAATDATQMHCRADADPDTVTNPVDADTDDGGVDDGSEDFDLNGAIDAGETDPTLGHGADDDSLDDDDGDGLTNGLEDSIGTKSDDADSDDDGVKDGDEPNFADDTDTDGTINALDTDSDDDGLLDGTELGTDCMDPATDAAAGVCVADADDGETKTNPLDRDTDDGSVNDGDEDLNHDGKVDPGERDPNDGSDDVIVGGEGGAGGEGTGGSMVAGSAGALVTAGNGGVMTAGTEGGGTANGGSAGSTAGNLGAGNEGNDGSVDGVLEGGGCACRSAAPASSPAPLTALVSILGLLGLAVARRRGRQG